MPFENLKLVGCNVRGGCLTDMSITLDVLKPYSHWTRMGRNQTLVCGGFVGKYSSNHQGQNGHIENQY